MRKNITFYRESNEYIIIDNRLFFYSKESNEITNKYYIEALLYDDDYFKNAIYRGFRLYKKWYCLSANGLTINKYFYIPLSRNFLDFYMHNWSKEELDPLTGKENENSITLSNINFKDDIDEFYELELEIQIESIRTKFRLSAALEDRLLILNPSTKEFQDKCSKLFGDPQLIEEKDQDRYVEIFARKCHYVPTSKIEKIIAVKKYKDSSSIGNPIGERYSGITEEFVLDLNNFNQETYKIFKIHGLLEIT